jgi:hypothetical protein
LVAGFAWMAICAIIHLVLYAHGQTPLVADALSSNLPLKYCAVEQLKEGRVPLWTSKLGCGAPLLADTISLPFDPRNLWWWVLPPVAAYWAMLVTSRLIFGWICLAYFRLRQGLSFGPALVGTVVYFLGTVLAEERHLHSTGVILEAFPLVLWLSERLLEKADFLRAVALACAWAALFYIGSLAYLVYLPVLCLTWVFGLWLFQRPRLGLLALVRFSALFGFGLLWATALCGVTFFPLVELVRHSNRGGEYPVDPFGFRSLFFALMGSHESKGWILSFNHFFYVGVISLPVLMGCWRDRSNAHVQMAKWLGCLTLVGLVILTSPLKPLLVKHFPVFATVAFFRISFFWGMLAAVLVGHGLQRAERSLSGWCLRSGRLLWYLHFGPVLCAPLVALWLLQLRFEWPLAYHDFKGLLKPYLGAIFLSLCAIRLTGLWVTARPVLKGEMRTALLGLLILGELLATWVCLRPGTPREDHFPITPEVAYLQHQRSDDYRLAEVLLPAGLTPDPQLTVHGYHSLYVDTAAVHGLATANLYESLLSRDFSRFMDRYGDMKTRQVHFNRATNAVMVTSVFDSPLLDAQGIRFLISRAELPARPDLRLRLRGEAFLVYERQRALPRAFFVANSRTGTSAQVGQWLDAANDYDFDEEPPLDFHNVVLLETSAGTPPPARAAVPIKGVPAHITRDADSTIEAAASCPADGFLVLSDNYFPGWQAFVDGEPVSIFKANGYAKAIPITAGKHTVLFRYEPASFTWGLYATLLSSGFTLIGCVAIWRSRRRKNRQTPAAAAEVEQRQLAAA